MDLILRNQQMFLKTQIPILNELINSHKKDLKLEWDGKKEALKKEFIEIIKDLQTSYEMLQRKKEAGEVNYVYLSFLRSAILLDQCFYRIDLYDENGQLSQVECCQNWRPDFLWNRLQVVREILTKKFSNRGIGLYFLDEMVLQYAEELHTAFIPLFQQIFENDEAEKPIFSSAVRVHMGEFLDSSEEIYWGQL